MSINELMKEFTEITDQARKIELYESIKIEQRKQEQAMMEALYPKENK
jgi:hypothetical protein